MRDHRHALLLFLIFLLVPGCAAPVVSLAPPAGPIPAREYPKIYDRWTRQGRVIGATNFDTVLLVHATMRSPEFEQAFIARHLSAYGIGDPGEQERFRQAEAVRTKDTLSFLVLVSGHSYAWTDLQKSKELWRMALIDDTGAETPASSVEQVRSRQALEVALYGHHLSGVFARSFNVSFPALRGDGQPLVRPGTSRLVLRIAGPQGKVDLSWALR